MAPAAVHGKGKDAKEKEKERQAERERAAAQAAKAQLAAQGGLKWVSPLLLDVNAARLQQDL